MPRETKVKLYLPKHLKESYGSWVGYNRKTRIIFCRSWLSSSIESEIKLMEKHNRENGHEVGIYSIITRNDVQFIDIIEDKPQDIDHSKWRPLPFAYLPPKEDKME